jgi:hypothetical protein
MNAPSSYRWAVIVAAFVVCACRSEAEREVSREVAAVAFAVNQLREAAHNDKEKPLAQLLAVSCTAPPACELQQVCASAYRLHADAVELGVQASKLGSDGYGPLIAADLLKRAEKQLEDANAGSKRCVQLQGELTREYKL